MLSKCGRGEFQSFTLKKHPHLKEEEEEEEEEEIKDKFLIF